MKILLTGATGGIGQALAKALAADGDYLLLQGRNRQRLEQLEKALGAEHCTTVVADLNNPQDREALVERAGEVGVDCLCNNAGINSFGPFSDVDVSGIIETNLSSTLLLTQALLPQLLSRDSARIVNIGSAFGAIGFPGYAVYCATKYALRGFSEALSRELADTGVRVHYFAPRATSTAMNAGSADALNQELGVSSDTPETVAKRILKALKSDRRRLQIGRKEALQTRVNALLPGMVDRAISDQLSTIKSHYPKETSHA